VAVRRMRHEFFAIVRAMPAASCSICKGERVRRLVRSKWKRQGSETSVVIVAQTFAILCSSPVHQGSKLLKPIAQSVVDPW